jgi:prevent-host-death family protein
MSQPKLVNIHEAKTNFSKLVARAESGEEVIIGRGGRAVARLVPFRSAASPRRPGALKGRITISSDFDEALPDVVGLFEGTES